jgi:hypothetical protein
MGYKALTANTSGTEGVAIGASAALANTTGHRNLAIGFEAYKAGDAEYDNVAMGYKALTANTGGTPNTAIGFQAMLTNTTAINNTAVGYNALNAQTDGTGRNACFGHEAGGAITSGNKNTCIGTSNGDAMVSNVNCMTLGYNAQASSNSATNEITFGDANTTALRSAAQSSAALSDARDKTDVVDLPHGLDFINQTRPVRFKWDIRDGQPGEGKQGTTNYGFIAQELLEIGNNEEHRLVYESNPDKLEARYSNLIPMMAQAIKELSAKNDSLETSNQALIARIEALENA